MLKSTIDHAQVGEIVLYCEVGRSYCFDTHFDVAVSGDKNEIVYHVS